jgi:hypothetical protein
MYLLERRQRYKDLGFPEGRIAIFSTRRTSLKNIRIGTAN